jgi:hypothetical protein
MRRYGCGTFTTSIQISQGHQVRFSNGFARRRYQALEGKRLAEEGVM